MGEKMINVSISPRVIDGILGWFTKKLFLSAYQASDDAHWQRQGTHGSWQSLGGVVEYLPDFLAITQDEEDPVYLLTLRAAPNVDLKRVTVRIKASKAGGIHQQDISVDRLCSIPVRKAITEIPLKPKRSNTTQGHKLGNVYIKLVEAVDNNGFDWVKGRKVAEIFSPTYMGSAHHRYAKRWGRYWNIDEINLAKHQLKTGYYRKLVQSAGQLWRPLRGRRVAYSILASDYGLCLAFWSRNLFGAKGIHASIEQDDHNRQSSIAACSSC